MFMESVDKITIADEHKTFRRRWYYGKYSKFYLADITHGIEEPIKIIGYADD
jgi:hypothetical protein